MNSTPRVTKFRQSMRDAGFTRFERWIPADKVEAMSAAYEAICKTPNAGTMEALADVKAGQVQAFDTLEALMKDLDAP